MPDLKIDQEAILSWLKSESTLSSTSSSKNGASQLGSSDRDNSHCDVTVNLDDGRVRTHRLVLSALSPFMLQLLLQEERQQLHDDRHSVLVLPGVRAKHFRALVAAVLSPHSRIASNKSRATKLREALSALATPLQLQHPAFRAPLPGYGESAEDSSSSSGCAPLYLSDVDVMGLSDETITDSFGDQKARLVCLVCYKIFAPGDHCKYREHVVKHDETMRRRIRVHQIKQDSQQQQQLQIEMPSAVRQSEIATTLRQAGKCQRKTRLPPKVPPAREAKKRRPSEPPNTTCKVGLTHTQ